MVFLRNTRGYHECYVFQSTLIDTMRQYAMIAAEEYLSKGGVEDEETQREFPQMETDAELAECLPASRERAPQLAHPVLTRRLDRSSISRIIPRLRPYRMVPVSVFAEPQSSKPTRKIGESKCS